MNAILCSTVLLIISLASFANDNFVQVKAASRSGKTLVVGHGSIQNIQENEIAAFFLREGQIEKPGFTFLSEAKCIKVNLTDSIWYLKDSISLGDLEGGDVVLVTKSYILNGHAKNNDIAKVVFSDQESIRKIHGKQTYPIWLQERYLSGVKVNTDLDDDEFLEDDGVFKDEDETPIVDNQLELDEEPIDQGDRYIDEFNRYTNVKLLKRSKKKELISAKEKASQRAELLNLTKGSFGKLESYQKGIIDLYDDVSVDKQDLIEDSSGVNNSFQEYNMATRGVKQSILEKKRSLKSLDDPLWPSGLSDLELRRYFLSHGIDELSQRKDLVVYNKPSHELLVKLSFSLNRNTTDEDPNYQTLNKSIYLGYEWHLMNASYMLRYFSLELGIEKTSGRYEIAEGINAYTYEIAGRLMLNFYLNTMPSGVGKLNWYIGAGGKIGNAVVNSINLSQEYNYSQVTIPSFQAGVKYRFRAGDEFDFLPKIGLGWNLAMIADNHSFYNSRELFDNIKPNFYAADIKIVLGLGLFF